MLIVVMIVVTMAMVMTMMTDYDHQGGYDDGSRACRSAMLAQSKRSPAAAGLFRLDAHVFSYVWSVGGPKPRREASLQIGGCLRPAHLSMRPIDPRLAPQMLCRL